MRQRNLGDFNRGGQVITCTFENGQVAKQPGLRHITVGAIVVKSNQILLALRAKVKGLIMLEAGKWALPGGYFDRGENLTSGIRREVMEESGWEIDNLQLFRINDNPDRPKEDRQNVDIIFIAKAVRQIGQHDQEVKEIKWFSFNDLPPANQIAFDHNDDLQLYLNHLSHPRQLPILG